MAYSKELAEKIRQFLSNQEDVREVSMFGGRCFMLNGKLLACAGKDRFLFRVGKDYYDESIDNGSVSLMINNGREMKNFVFVDQKGVDSDERFAQWMQTCMTFNETLKDK